MQQAARDKVLAKVAPFAILGHAAIGVDHSALNIRRCIRQPTHS
jgi:hypothetical protein